MDENFAPVPTVLIVAGSDSSAGAGVQADLKTCLAFGVFSTSVVTAVTAQGPDGISAISAVPADVVHAQLAAALDAAKPAAVKVGMLGNAGIVATVHESLRGLDVPIIVDPVLCSSSGTSLLDTPGQHLLSEKLLPIATLITPNQHEAERLCDQGGPSEWALRLETAILVTGGHDTEAWIEDRLHLPDGSNRTWRKPRIITHRSRGTGCVLSSSIAAGLALGEDLNSAIDNAITFTRALLLRSSQDQLGDKAGALFHPPIVLRETP